MNTSEFLSPEFLTTPYFLVGQMLAAGEPHAPVHALTSPQQAALLLCLARDRLDFNGRLGWRMAGGDEPRLYGATIELLADLKLLAVHRRTTRTATARLTQNGNWYARTVVSIRMAALDRIKTNSNGAIR